MRLAFNSGEVAGLSNSWESTKSTWRKELESGELKLVLQATLKPHPEFPKLPMALNYAKTEEAKLLISTVARVHGPTVRPYVLPPNTPKDRVQIIRKAFMDTMKDPDFLAEAKKANLDINADDVARSVVRWSAGATAQISGPLAVAVAFLGRHELSEQTKRIPLPFFFQIERNDTFDAAVGLRYRLTDSGVRALLLEPYI